MNQYENKETLDMFLDKFLTFYDRNFENTELFKRQWNKYIDFVNSVTQHIENELQKNGVNVFNLKHKSFPGTNISKWIKTISEYPSGIPQEYIPPIFKNTINHAYKYGVFKMSNVVNSEFLNGINDLKDIVHILKIGKEAALFSDLNKIYNIFSLEFFICSEDKKKTFNNLVKYNVAFLHSGVHVTCAIIDNEKKEIEFFDPSYSHQSINEFLIPLMICCCPELCDYTILIVVDYSIQDLSDYSSYIDIFCKIWCLHYIYYRMHYKLTASQYKQMFDTLYIDKHRYNIRTNVEQMSHKIKTEASIKIKSEIKTFLLKLLSSSDFENLKNIQYGGIDLEKKYIKYKQKYNNLKNLKNLKN